MVIINSIDAIPVIIARDLGQLNALCVREKEPHGGMIVPVRAAKVEAINFVMYAKDVEKYVDN